MTLRLPPFLLALPLLALSACSPALDPGPAPAPQITGARIVMPPPGAPMAAGYFELQNTGATTLELRGVTSPAFESVEMHETVEEQGLSRMRGIDGATIAPGATLQFEPGGKHLMLMGPKLPEPAPASVSLTLDLRTAEGVSQPLETQFTVEQAGESYEHHHH